MRKHLLTSMAAFALLTAAPAWADNISVTLKGADDAEVGFVEFNPAKGGMIFAIQQTLGLPVHYVGLGEGINDLVPFRPDFFVDSLFEEE